MTVAFMSKDELRRWKLYESIVKAVVAGYAYDPGDSDLDDEQPIYVSMTLGDYRRACEIK